jgi:hypothetical protein
VSLIESRVWNAFLPISSVSDKVEEVSADWLAQRGCTESALRVLRAIRHEVLPTVRSGRLWALSSFSMLVHDHTSGVPCPPEDARAFIHLRLSFSTEVDEKHLRHQQNRLDKWCYLTPIKPTPAEKKVHRLLDAQSEWYVSLVEANLKLSDLELLQLIRQHLHYFANMSQMRIQ